MKLLGPYNLEVVNPQPFNVEWDQLAQPPLGIDIQNQSGLLLQVTVAGQTMWHSPWTARYYAVPAALGLVTVLVVLDVVPTAADPLILTATVYQVGDAPPVIVERALTGLAAVAAIAGTVAVAISDPVSIAGVVDVAGNINVENAVTLSGTSPVSISDPISIDGTVEVAGNVNVGNAVTLSGTSPVSISDPISIDGTVEVAGNVVVTNTIDATITGNVAISDPIVISAGEVTLTGTSPVEVTSAPPVTGTVDIGTPVDIAGTVAIEGPVTVTNNVAATVTGAVGITDPVSISGTVEIAGSVEVTNTINADVTGTVVISDPVSISGGVVDATVTNDITISGTPSVSIGDTATSHIGTITSTISGLYDTNIVIPSWVASIGLMFNNGGTPGAMVLTATGLTSGLQYLNTNEGYGLTAAPIFFDIVPGLDSDIQFGIIGGPITIYVVGSPLSSANGGNNSPSQPLITEGIRWPLTPYTVGVNGPLCPAQAAGYGYQVSSMLVYGLATAAGQYISIRGLSSGAEMALLYATGAGYFWLPPATPDDFLVAEGLEAVGTFGTSWNATAWVRSQLLYYNNSV